MLAAMCVGAVFVVAGLLVRPRDRRDEVRVVGTVASSWVGWSGGQRTWRYSVEFRDNVGNVWSFEPPLSRGREQQVGVEVPVAYLTSAPAETARRSDGPDAHVHWILIGAGVLAAAIFPFIS